MLIVVLAILGAFLVWIARDETVRVDPYEVELTVLGVCLPVNGADGLEEPVSGLIPASETSVFACGRLSTTSPVGLAIYLFKDQAVDPIDQDPYEEEAINGAFSSELRLPSEGRLGHYRIEVYAARKKLGSVEFDVVDQVPAA